MLFYWPKLLYPYYSLLLFSLSLLSVYRLVLWGCVYGLIGCISLSLNLALPTFFNNNNNKYTLCLFPEHTTLKFTIVFHGDHR